MKVIKSVTAQGISYIDEVGLDGFVDFIECNENWIRYRKRTENLNDEKLAELKGRDKCIGQRDICGAPCAFEFFTRPFTRFEFIQSTECPVPKEAFVELQNKITSFGWTTLDMS